MARLTIDDMVTRIQRRLPTGLDAGLLRDTLNELYSQVNVKPVKWNLISASLTLTKGASETTASLPSDYSPGMPSFLSGDPALDYPVEIPWKPANEAFRHQKYAFAPVVGQYSLWTDRSNGAGGYTAIFFPYEAGGSHTLKLVYHKTIDWVTAGQSFPWPREFDVLLIDLCEAEIRRQNQWAAWEVPLKKAQDQITAMVEMYLTTKQVMAGMALEQRKGAEVVAAGRPR